MSFPGHPPKAPKEPTPLRTYEFLDFGKRKHTVKAHYLTFTSGHVNFWESRDDAEQDSLVLSQTNTHINSLKEVTT